MRRSRLIATLLLPTLLAPALARAEVDTDPRPDPARFARAWPVDAPAGVPLFSVVLPPEVYADLADNGLGDLVVVDASGTAQPMRVERLPTSPRREVVSRRDLPAPLALPAAVAMSTTAGGSALDVEVRRDADGRLEGLRIDEAGLAAAAANEWLVDTGPDDRERVDALRLRLPEDLPSLRLGVVVEDSEDLVRWQGDGAIAPLLRLGDGAQRVERLEVPLRPGAGRYLRLRLVDGGWPAGLPFALEALRYDAPPPLPSPVVRREPRSTSANGRRSTFAGVGALPVTAITLEVDGDNVVLPWSMHEGEGDARRTIATGTAWQLTVAGRPLTSDPTPLTMPRGDVELDVALPAAGPRLVLSYTPHRVVVVPAGTSPYRLLAGSATWRRTDVDLDAAVAAVQGAQGPDWTLPSARLGAPVDLGGRAALTAPAPDRRGQWLLWGVLGLGALVVGGFAWRMLRVPSAPG